MAGKQKGPLGISPGRVFLYVRLVLGPFRRFLFSAGISPPFELFALLRAPEGPLRPFYSPPAGFPSGRSFVSLQTCSILVFSQTSKSP